MVLFTYYGQVKKALQLEKKIDFFKAMLLFLYKFNYRKLVIEFINKKNNIIVIALYSNFDFINDMNYPIKAYKGVIRDQNKSLNKIHK